MLVAALTISIIGCFLAGCGAFVGFFEAEDDGFTAFLALLFLVFLVLAILTGLANTDGNKLQKQHENDQKTICKIQNGHLENGSCVIGNS